MPERPLGPPGNWVYALASRIRDGEEAAERGFRRLVTIRRELTTSAAIETAEAGDMEEDGFDRAIADEGIHGR